MTDGSRIYKGVFVAYFILLLLHLVISRYWTIYPSLVFPAFASAPKISDAVDIPLTDLYAIAPDGQLLKVNKEKFFSDLYVNHVNFFLKTISSNEKKYKGHKRLTSSRVAFVNYAKSRLDQLYGTTRFIGLLIVQGQQSYSTKDEKLKTTIKAMQKHYIYFNEN